MGEYHGDVKKSTKRTICYIQQAYFMLYCIDLKEFQQYHKQYDYQKYDQEIL